MMNRDEQSAPTPEEGTVLKTEGEDSARAYVASALPEGTACPTIEVDRVRVMPPSQTPTVQLTELAKRPGPRAPEQMVKPEPKGPVELPDGRPVTKMQRILIDSDFLIELARLRAEGAVRVGGEGEPGESAPGDAAEGHDADAHAAETVPAAPVSRPDVGARPAKRPVLMMVAIAVTAGVVAIAAMRPVREPAPGAAVPSVTTGSSVTASVAPSAAVVPSAITTSSPGTAPSPSAEPSATATPSEPSPQAIKLPRQKRIDEDPYGAAPAPSPPPTAAPAVTTAPSAVPAVTTATPPAPAGPAPVAPAPEPTIKPVF